MTTLTAEEKDRIRANAAATADDRLREQLRRTAASLTECAASYANAVRQERWKLRGMTREEWHAEIFSGLTLSRETRVLVEQLLSDSGMPYREIAEHVGVSKSAVADDLAGVHLPDTSHGNARKEAARTREAARRKAAPARDDSAAAIREAAEKAAARLREQIANRETDPFEVTPLSAPELPVPDLSIPDLSIPDLSIPDLPEVDQAPEVEQPGECQHASAWLAWYCDFCEIRTEPVFGQVLAALRDVNASKEEWSRLRDYAADRMEAA